MATVPDRRLPFLPTLFAGLMLAVLAQSAEEAKSPGEIVLDLDKCNVDLKSDTAICRDVTISQGDARVQAKHARGSLRFDDGRWTFEGDVQLYVEQRGKLHSDQAVVDFRDNRIEKAVITGNPAEFEQKIDESGRVARGRAGEIVYDAGAGIVRLTKDAWLASEGRPELSAPLIVYNIRLKQVQASSASDSQRVRIVIPVKKPADRARDNSNAKPAT